MDDPIEKLHKVDKLLDRVYCHMRDYETREESKRRAEARSRHPEVLKQIKKVHHSRKRQWSAATLEKRRLKKEDAAAVKKERRSLL
mmetsp:Transcript_2883/g.4652  ORF Transcript_2883/g.4652 Transcript_2883/m.4652 type:complete len:86 (-) Transcript_2883:47-304(-)